MKRPLLLGLLLCGCFNPDDILPLKGQLTSVDPVEGQKVLLLREQTIDTGASCSTAKTFKETTADKRGAFGFEVFRAQAQKLTGFGQFCFRAQTTFSSGTFVFSDVRELVSEYHLPDFPDWRAAPVLQGEVLGFTPLAPIPPEESLTGDQVVHRVTFSAGDGIAWQQVDRVLSLESGMPVRQPLRLGDYALEDFGGEAALEGKSTQASTDGSPFGDETTSFQARAGQTLMLQGTRTPVSRGRSCAPLADPCPLTDGSLTPVVLSGANSLTVDLGAPTAVSAVVLRGLEASDTLIAVVPTGADGGTLLLVQHVLDTPLWGGLSSVTPRPRRDGGISFSSVDPRFAVIPLDGGVVSKVTVSIPGGADALSELSVF